MMRDYHHSFFLSSSLIFSRIFFFFLFNFDRRKWREKKKRAKEYIARKTVNTFYCECHVYNGVVVHQFVIRTEMNFG